MSQVNAIWQLYLFYGLIVALGISAVEVTLLSTVARWFVKKRGTMSGISKIGAGLGMFSIPPLANCLISAYGWRTALVILGILILVLVLPVAQLLRRNPGQTQQLPNGDKEATISSLESTGGGLSLREAMRTRQFWTICAIFSKIKEYILCISGEDGY